MKKDVKVRQKVWLQERGSRQISDKAALRETEITKVGKKYLYVKNYGQDLKFDLEQLKHINGRYSARFTLWLSDLDYRNYVERSELMDSVKKVFREYNPKLTLEQLRKIHQILQEDDTK